MCRVLSFWMFLVGEGAAVLELLAREDEALLVGRDALLVLDLLLHVLDRVRRLDVQRDGLARQCLHKDLRGPRGPPVRDNRWRAARSLPSPASRRCRPGPPPSPGRPAPQPPTQPATATAPGSPPVLGPVYVPLRRHHARHACPQVGWGARGCATKAVKSGETELPRAVRRAAATHVHATGAAPSMGHHAGTQLPGHPLASSTAAVSAAKIPSAIWWMEQGSLREPGLGDIITPRWGTVPSAGPDIAKPVSAPQG